MLHQGWHATIVSQQKVSKTAGTRCHSAMLPGKSAAADAIDQH
jgi:hypothetical protein